MSDATSTAKLAGKAGVCPAGECVAHGARYEALFSSAVDFGIIVLDPQGLITDWNTGAERIFGWSAAEMIGQPADRFFTDEDRAADRPETEMRLCLTQGRAADDRWHLRRDGSRFWARGEMMPLRGKDGAHLGYFKILRDRTEQHQAAERHRADSEFLRGILASSGDCIKVLDLDGRLLFMNENGRQLMEVPDFAAVQGCPWPDFWRDQGHADAVAALEAARRGGAGHFVGAADTYAGNPRFWDVQVTPIQDRQGRPEKLLAVSRDITAAHRAERRLRELNDTLEQQVEARTRERDSLWRMSRDPFLIVDRAGTWQRVNPAWTEILGWPDSDLLGRTAAWMAHPDEAPSASANLGLLAADSAARRYENRLRARDGGYRWFSWTAMPAEGLFYCVARDVTAEKELRESRRQLEDQLRQSQKMEAVGQLTGGLAHDFNNLLTGIAGSLELLQTRVAQGRLEGVNRYIDAAQGAARRAATLTHRLLAFSRQQTLDPRPTDASRLVAGLEELIRRTIGPAITLQIEADADLWNTLVDASQLENAVLNLCINARDAMPNGGTLRVGMRNRSWDARAAAEMDVPPGQYIQILVGDTGCGMSAEVAARAFDPFFTTKPIGQGTGLGLSMIYGFTRQSGGQARIETSPDGGTTVCLTLPRHLGEAEVTEVTAGSPQIAPAGQGETVLVVDDEPTVRMLVAEVLRDLGYTALEAADGTAALAALHAGGRFDLLITDVGLPGGMNGRQMAEAARLARPGLKVLFITGYAEHAVLGHEPLAEGLHVLVKPFAMEALASRIRGLLATS